MYFFTFLVNFDWDREERFLPVSVFMYSFYHDILDIEWLLFRKKVTKSE